MSTDPVTITAEPTPEQVVSAIRTAWETFLLKDRSTPTKRNNVWSSSYRECDRQMVLDMVEGDKQPVFSSDTLAKFRRGNDRERELLADLSRIGRDCEITFELVGQQERFELRGKNGRVVLSGKVDAFLVLTNRSTRKQTRIPIEVKAWHPNLTAKIHKFEDVFNNRWTKGGGYQLLSYLYGQDLPLGFLLLDRSGIPTLIPVELFENLDRMERFLSKAEKAMDHKEASTLPDYIDDPSECKVCPYFGSVCLPPMKAGAGAQVFVDPEVIQQAERYVELETKLEEAGLEEYTALDKWATKMFRGVTQGIVGNLMVSGKWTKRKVYKVPEEVEKSLQERQKLIDDEYEKYQESNPQGAFSFRITKVL